MTPELILQKLQEANLAYRAGTPIMSDEEYDALEDMARTLPDPKGQISAFLSTVGAPANAHWVKVRHPRSMTSLNKAQNLAEFNSWLNSMGADEEIVWSEKLDGLSGLLTYRDGVLCVAAKRGDGDEGEDITRNVLRMKGIPTSVPGFTGLVRGEITLKRSDYAVHFYDYSNPRNAAAGITNRLDGGGCEHLTFLAYHMDGYTHKTAMFLALKAAGFCIPNYGLLDEAPEDLRDNYDRDSLDYDIDGLVFELNDQVKFDSLGEVSRRPRGAIAFKFASASKPTILRDVVWQVGKSGRVTPVAVFDPVELMGANIERATLHNILYIYNLTKKKGLGVGDVILVSRQNDVIPAVQAVLSPSNGQYLVQPTACPECSTTLERDGAYLVCPGLECPAQIIGLISRWVKKTGILGIGDSVIQGLIDAEKINDPADLYTMSDISEVLVGGARLGASAKTIIEEIHSKRQLSLFVFVGSLGIPLCSRSVCRLVQEAGYDTLEKMRSATVEELSNIPNIGEVRAASFVDGLAHHKSLIDKLLANGVHIKTQASGALKGMSFCFTGIRDPALEVAIEQAGGTIKSSVSKGLTYLVVKDTSITTTKTQTAQKIGCKIISIQEARVMI